MKSLKILVVDDDPDLAWGIADVLEIEGHDTMVILTGEEALEQMTGQAVDLAFVDVKLPGIHGIKVMCELRRRYPDLPVIVMTGFRIEQLFTHVFGPGRVHTMEQADFLASPEKWLTDKGSPPGLILLSQSANDQVAQVIQSLEAVGQRVALADTLEKARGEDAAAPIDVLVLDWDEPLIRGLEVFIDREGRGKAVPTLFINSAADDLAARRDPLQTLRSTGCLFKPFELQVLVGLLEGYATDPAAMNRNGAAVSRDTGNDAPPADPRGTLLIVEDEPELRALVARYLRATGYQVVEAINGTMALQILAESPEIDLLFTDLRLEHGMTGLDLADRAHALLPELKVMFTTGNVAKSFDWAAAAVHDDDVVEKPYELKDLERRIGLRLGLSGATTKTKT